MEDHPGKPFPHYGEEMAARRRRRRIHRIFGVVLLLFVTVPVGGWVATDQYASHRLKKTLKQIRKAGYAVELKSMAPAAVESTDNAAPLYEAAFASISDLVPSLGSFTWAECGHTEDDEREIMGLVGRCGTALDLARMARAKPYCRFDRDYSGKREEERPDFQRSIALATALSHRAMDQAAGGRPAEARETIRDLWALARAFQEEPRDWSQTITRLLWQMALEATAGCSRHSETESEWRAWQGELPDPSRLRASIQRAFRGELAFWAGDARRGHPLTLQRLFPNEPRRLMRLLRPVMTLGAEKGLARFQKTISRLEGAELTPDILEQYDPVGYLGYGRFSMIDVVARPRMWLRNHLTVEAEFAVVRAGMECERHRAAEGAYPDVIAERDPMTGAALKYSEDRLSLFSDHPDGRANLWYYEEEGLTWKLLRPAD